MFDTCFQLLITQKIILFCGSHGLTWCSFYLLLLLLLIFSFFNTPIPKLTKPRSFLFLFFFSFNPQYPQQPLTEPRSFFFLFLCFLQPPIPTTTTLVLSLNHKPIKFISILDRPIFDLKQILFGAHFRQLLFLHWWEESFVLEDD